MSLRQWSALSLFWSLCIGLAMAGWAATTVAAGNTPVLIVHSYSQEYPWTKRQHEGFMRTLNAAATGSLSAGVEYLDTKRLTYTPAYADLMGHYLERKYQGFNPRIIYVTDDNALLFAVSHLSRIFPAAPIFFSGVNDYGAKNRIDPARVTGVFERKEIAPNLQLMRALAPEERSILVVGDESETARAIRREIDTELAAQPDVHTHFVSNGRIDGLVEGLRGRRERFLFLTTLGAMQDASGRTLTLNETISAIVGSGTFVVMSMEDVYIQAGVLGGYVTSGDDQGRAAAEMALRYLSGTAVSNIQPLEASPNRYIIDGTELERAGLVLPDGIAGGASIINQPATFYQRNIDLIVQIFYALLALFVLSLSASLYLVSRKGRQLTRTTADLEAQALVMAETQESLTRAQRIAHMGNWDWRVKEGTYYWSDGMYRLVGVAPGDGVPSHAKFLACIPPDDRQQVADAIQSSLMHGTPYNQTHRLVDQRGAIRIVQESGEVVRGADGTPERMISTVLDITEQALTTQALHDSEEKLRAVIEAFPVILWAIDREGIFTLARGAGLKLLGVTGEKMVGQSLFDMYRDNPGIIEDVRKVLAGDSLVSTRWVNESAFDIRYSPLRGPVGEVIGAIGVAADVTENKHSEERLLWLANYDPVTSLPNRNLFSDRLGHAINNARRGGSSVTLLFLDLDKFKNVNDTLGHAAGDELLTQVAQRLLSVIRTSDTACRLGGDEFTIILENMGRAESAAVVAQKIIEQSGRPFQVQGREIFISTSIGIALYPGDGENAEALLMSADAAMYRAKSAGRNNFQFSSKEANAGVRNRLELGTQLQRALERGEYSLHYQPQVDARDGRVVGFEALLRWQSQDRGSVPPGLFIPILEETGLIVPVGEWVLGEACRWASQLPDDGDDAPLISVNLSPRQFLHPDLYRMVENALMTTKLSVQRLELEITESSLIDPHMNIATMERLKRLGVHLTIDDFGTGYSSLSYLKRFPVDRLKIDASFVRDVAVDTNDAAIVTAIIALSDSLRLRAVAEGVETAEQLQFLLSRGCHEIQGYYIARPMPGDAAKAWLESWHNGGRRALLSV